MKSSGEQEYTNYNALKLVLDSDDDMIYLLHTLQDADYLKDVYSREDPACKEYTDDEVFNYNFYFWCTGFFFFGLQFTHFDIGPMASFSLTWEAM